MSDPVVVVLFYASLAAAMAALGALPFRFGSGPPAAAVGGAEALAGGMMLGAGYLLMIEALEGDARLAVLGAGLGGLYNLAIQRSTGSDRLELATARPLDLEQAVRTILQSTMHAAAEGVAIGVAMVRDLRLGIFLALALGVHNIAEGMSLTAALRRRGTPIMASAGLCVVTNVAQPVLAVFAFAVLPAFPALVTTAIGFAAGSLAYLVLTELVPASYRRASRTLVAIVLSATAALVVLLEGLLLR